MQKFFIIRKMAFTNGQHFAFMESFVGDLKKIEGAPEKLQTLIDAMAAAVAQEDKYLKIAQGSDLTELIREADVQRDNAYRKLRDMVKLWADSGVDPQAAAAKALARVIKTYNINTEAQMDQESGMMGNLLTDISTTEMKAHQTTLNVTSFVETMSEGNDRVKALLKERDEAGAGKVTGALRTARLASDKAYNAVVEAIEAFNFVVGGYDDVIKTWNSTINRYQEMLNRKTGGGKTNKPDTGGEEPDLPTIGGEPGDGGGSTGGGDDSGSGEIPDLPTIGGEPGDGGGNTGGDTGGDSFEE